jgi:hypothetical protein
VSITETLFDKLTRAVTESSERVRAQIEAGFAQSENGVRLQGALARTIYPNTLAWGGQGRLLGWSARAGGADAVVTLHDGRSAEAEPLAVVTVPANTTSNVTLPAGGASITEAVFASVTAGTITGTLYLSAKGD